MASENHNKKPLVIERRRGKERKKTPRLTKTYEVKIIPATIGVVMETEEPPKKRVAASRIILGQARLLRTSCVTKNIAAMF